MSKLLTGTVYIDIYKSSLTNAIEACNVLHQLEQPDTLFVPLSLQNLSLESVVTDPN